MTNAIIDHGIDNRHGSWSILGVECYIFDRVDLNFQLKLAIFLHEINRIIC